MRRRDPERDARVRDLALGAYEALRHRRLGDEERAGDLPGGEAAERAQDQRDLRLEGERRVRAGEEQLEPFVAEGRLLVLVGELVHGVGDLWELAAGLDPAIAPQPVDRAVARRDDQPRGGVLRRAGARPALGRDRERLLGGLLGAVEVAEEADHGGKHPPPLLAEDLLDQGDTSGRTSTAPPMRAAGIRAANSIAPSRSSASSTQ